MTMLDSDIEVHIDELTEDAPPICNLNDCEERAAWVPICPKGHILKMRSSDKPAYVCDLHGKQYPGFLLHRMMTGNMLACHDCGSILDGTLIPIP